MTKKKRIALYAVAGASLAIIVMLAAAATSSDWRSYYALINNFGKLAIPAIAGAALGAAVGTLRG